MEPNGLIHLAKAQLQAEQTEAAQRTITSVNLIPSQNIPVVFAGMKAEESEYKGFTPENRLERDIRAILNRS